MHRGAKLRQLRNERGLKQVELAQKLETTASTLCQYEIGNTQVRPQLLERWCAFFGITVKELDEIRGNDPSSHWRPFIYRDAMKS